MTRVQYVKCRRKNTIIRKVTEQKRRRILCLKYKVEKKKNGETRREVVYPIEEKVQQISTWTGALKSTARKGSEQRDLRKIV